MPIRVACQCGKAFAAPDNLAGKAVKCPGCGQPLRIPGGAAAPAPARPAAPQPAPLSGGLADLLDEAGIAQHAGPRCPQCEAPLAPTAVLCVKCGFHRQSGQRVYSEVKAGGKEIGHGDAASFLMARAAAEVAASPVAKDDKDTGGVASIWTWVFMLFLPGLFTLGFFVAGWWGGTLAAPAYMMLNAIKTGHYLLLIPGLLIAGGILLLAFGWLNVTSVALDRNVWHGLGCMLLIGTYCYFWGLFNWKHAKSQMLMYLSGIWLLTFGYYALIGCVAIETGGWAINIPLLLIFTGQLLSFVGITHITLIALEEGLGHGLACMLTGIYAPIYGFMRWAQCKMPQLLFLAGFGTTIFGVVVMVGLAAGGMLKAPNLIGFIEEMNAQAQQDAGE